MSHRSPTETDPLVKYFHAKITDVLMNEHKRSLNCKFLHSCSFNVMAIFGAAAKS